MEITIAYIQMTTENKIEQTGPNLLNIDVGEPIELNDNEDEKPAIWWQGNGKRNERHGYTSIQNL